jgi:hypothetical protein
MVASVKFPCPLATHTQPTPARASSRPQISSRYLSVSAAVGGGDSDAAQADERGEDARGEPPRGEKDNS